MTSIADRVRELRVAAGLSQTALAGSSFSPSYISLIEAGHREPTDAALAVLAARLVTTVEYLKHGEDGPNEARARLALSFARLDLANGDADGALQRVEAIELSRVTPSLRVDGLELAALCSAQLGDLEKAADILEPLLREQRDRGHFLDAARIASRLVFVYIESGDLHRSVEVGETELDWLAKEDLVGTDEHLRLGSTVLWAYVERGDLLFATHRAAELIRLAESLGSPRGRGSVYWNAALVAQERHDYELAQRYTERALALLSEGDSDRDLPRLRLNYAWLLLRSDPPEPEAALDQLRRAVPALEVIGSAVDRARAAGEMSRAHLQLGEAIEAEGLAREAIGLLGEGPRLETAQALLHLADALHAQGRSGEADQDYQRAADMLAMMAASRQSAAAWRELGDRYRAHGDIDAAVRAYDHALSEAGFRVSLPTVAEQAWIV
jgi:tetratricopeptide (TPR) repeat protein